MYPVDAFHYRRIGYYLRCVYTTNATPKYIGVNASGRLVLEDKRMVGFKGMVVARTYTGDVNAVWFFRGAIKRGEGVGTVALLGVPIKEVYYKDGGAATWDIEVKADVTNGALEVEVTGQASTGIYWTSHVEWIKTTSQ